MENQLTPLYRFWQPRFWMTWLVLGVLRLIVLLPQSARMAVGRGLGRLALRLLKPRRMVARRNLELCFPELSDAELEDLTRRHFESLGMGVIELAMAWWLSDRQLTRLVEFSGLEHVSAALEQGKGAIMLSGHFAVTEISGRVLKEYLPPMAAMYRPSDNPMNDQIMRRIRGGAVGDLITKKGIRKLIKILRANRPVWYASDQAYEGKGAALIDFFSEPAMTNTAINQISKLSGAPVVPFYPVRLHNGRRYEIAFKPAFADFPSDDPVADARRVNEFLEESIRQAPEQYYWVHKRFKGRPEGYADPYSQRQNSRS